MEISAEAKPRSELCKSETGYDFWAVKNILIIFYI